MTCKSVFVLAVICLTCICQSGAQNTYPLLQKFRKPDPAPPPPGEPFLPPMKGKARAKTPRCAEWTRTAGPDESLVLAGVDFSSFTGIREGSDTRFVTYGKNKLRDAKILQAEAGKAIITLDKDLGDWSMYLIWPKNDAGYGEPIAVNKTDAWWVGPDKVGRGKWTSVFGRNLSYSNATSTSYVYLQLPSGAGQWLHVGQVNPYKVDFRVPADLPNGRYALWVHNGHGGEYGWSGPLTLHIDNGPSWAGSVFDVKKYGASGNGQDDDTAPILRAISEAGQVEGATVYFPAGVYLISNTIELGSNMRWKGDGQDKTYIKCSAAFSRTTSSVVYGNVTNAEIVNMSFESHQMSLQNNVDKAVFLRGSSDVRLTNVRFYFPAFTVFDFHLGKHIYVNGCTVTGISAFLGNCSQLFIDRCNFLLTDDADVMLFSWGGTGVSVTNSTCSDFDNADPNNGAGWGKGRFFVGSGVWGSNRFTYLGNNKTTDLTVRPSGPDQNSGEQFLWEGNATLWSGFAQASTDSITTLSAVPGADIVGCYAAIVSGKGHGQVRRVLGYSNGAISVEEPWSLAPDNTSVLNIGTYTDKVVVYKNSLDAKSYAATSESHIASVGIQPYGGVFNFIADGNTLNEVRAGISNWVVNSEGGLDPSFFHLYCNNRIVNSRWGIVNNAFVSTPDPGVAMFGTVYRRNRIKNAVEAGVLNIVEGAEKTVLGSAVYEHNKLTGTPKGFASGMAGVNGQVWYNNYLENSGAGSPYPAVQITPRNVLRQNTYRGFAAPYTDGIRPMLEAPYHVIELTVNAGSPSMDTSLVLWNAGATALEWTASTDASWLSLLPANGRIQNENEAGMIQLSINASNLAAGKYKATVAVGVGTEKKTYTLLLNVTGVCCDIVEYL